MAMYKHIQSHLEQIFGNVQDMKTSYPEIEIRFGKIDNETKVFSTDVGYDRFNSILRTCLQTQSKCWSQIIGPVQSSDYFTDGFRLTEYCNQNKRFVKIQKQKLGVLNIQNDDNIEDESANELDIRISVAAEIPSEIASSEESVPPEKTNYEFVRHKKRWTFVYKHIWQYDFTVVNIPDSVNKTVRTSYEIEMELIQPKNTVLVYTPQYLAHSAILKINDIICLANGTFFDEEIEDSEAMEQLSLSD